MTVKQTMFALLVALIALIWGAKDWLMWHWEGLSADSQIKWFAGVVLFLTLILSRIFTPFIWHNFS